MPFDLPDRIAEVRVETMADCPSADAFLALAADKAPADWQVRGPGEGAPDLRFVVTLSNRPANKPANQPPSKPANESASLPAGAARGTLDGGGEPRVIEGASCATVAEAVAFSLVLRLRQAKRADAPVPSKTQVAPAPRPVLATAPSRRATEIEPWFESGTELSAAWGTAPNPLGGGIFVGAGVTIGAFTPGLRATIVRGFVGRPDPLAGAVFETAGLRLDTCPIVGRVWRLRISPCVGVGVSALALATESDVVTYTESLEGSVAQPANPRLNALALARTQLRALDPLLFELTLGLTANPVVEGYSFNDHPQAWEGAVLGPFVAIALGVAIE